MRHARIIPFKVIKKLLLLTAIPVRKRPNIWWRLFWILEAEYITFGNIVPSHFIG